MSESLKKMEQHKLRITENKEDSTLRDGACTCNKWKQDSSSRAELIAAHDEHAGVKRTHKLTLSDLDKDARSEKNTGWKRGRCSCNKWATSRPEIEMEAAHREHCKKVLGISYSYGQFAGEMKQVGKSIMPRDMWVKERMTADEYCQKVYNRTRQQLLKDLVEKKAILHAEDPYVQKADTIDGQKIRQRLLKSNTRVQLIRMGELTGGLEIPFIKLWNSLPNKTTTILEMSKIFTEALADKRLATAQNMIRRAVKRGDAKILE